MFVVSEKDKEIKIWLNDISEIDANTLEQAKQVAALDCVRPWMALMPDAHLGYAFPIGSVVPVVGAIFPYGVGTDIGCGVRYAKLNIKADLLRRDDKLTDDVGTEIYARVPVGFMHFAEPRDWNGLIALESERIAASAEYKEFLDKIIGMSHYSVGTLGSGNHFIEITEDNEGWLGVLVHTGSRNVGAEICRYFHQIAKDMSSTDLGFLPAATTEAWQYLSLMNHAISFARTNRHIITEVVLDVLRKVLGNEEIKEVHTIDCVHNYASAEVHHGTEVFVHRKGAVRANEGMEAVIPGAMGSKSYIVRGKGNPESFNSCSHGAGRKLSRRQAQDAISEDEVIDDLTKQGINLICATGSKIAAESKLAYKDIDTVMALQADLVDIVGSLTGFIVIKG